MMSNDMLYQHNPDGSRTATTTAQQLATTGSASQFDDFMRRMQEIQDRNARWQSEDRRRMLASMEPKTFGGNARVGGSSAPGHTSPEQMKDTAYRDFMRQYEMAKARIDLNPPKGQNFGFNNQTLGYVPDTTMLPLSMRPAGAGMAAAAGGGGGGANKENAPYGYKTTKDQYGNTVQTPITWQEHQASLMGGFGTGPDVKQPAGTQLG